MSLVHGRKIAAAIPLRFDGWRQMDTSAIVVPESDGSLAKKLYTEQVTRLYVRGDQDYVMLLIAYGDTQNDLLQLHRPEVCYPAFGFQVTTSIARPIDLGSSVSLPSRSLTASTPERTEHISYWTRIGEYLPVDNDEQRGAKFRSQLAGIVPDGILVRISGTAADANEAFDKNAEFAASMIRNTNRDLWPALITTEKARELTRRA